ncbi:MAG: hypothetical protein P1V97_18625, partial [Planctomycetota bacterium]|nr:hypothetical protein [Planctomycetota bacterium]
EKAKPQSRELKDRLIKSLRDHFSIFAHSYLNLEKPIYVCASRQAAFFYNYELGRIDGCRSWQDNCFVMALSRSGEYSATVHSSPKERQQSTVKLWSGSIGQFIREWSYPAQKIVSLAFSPDSQEIYFGSNINSAVSVSDLNGRRLRTLENPEGQGSVGRFSFAQKGRFLLATDGYGFIWIWDNRSVMLVANLKAHDDWVSYCLSSGEKHLVTSASKEKLKIWDFEDMLKTLRTPGKELFKSVKNRIKRDANQLIKRSH